MMGFLSPVLTRQDDGRVFVLGGEFDGKEVVSHLEAQWCARRPDGERADVLCGLVRGHHGSCWLCSLDLVTESGPFALRRSQ